MQKMRCKMAEKLAEAVVMIYVFSLHIKTRKLHDMLDLAIVVVLLCVFFNCMNSDMNLDLKANGS